MITLENRDDDQVAHWFVMEKYDLDINNALLTGSLNSRETTSVESPTGTSVSVVWALGEYPKELCAACTMMDGNTASFYNDPMPWAKVS